MDEDIAKVPPDYWLMGPSDDGTVGDILKELDAKLARQRLQALIAEWLRMENVVVLTAAGCSVTSGGKVMTNLESSVLATVSILADCTDNLRGFINDRLANRNKSDQPAFEEWLSFLVNAAFVGSAKQSPFASFEWKKKPGPTAKELEWFVEVVGNSQSAR